MATLVLEFKQIESDGEKKNSIFHSFSKTETIINENDIDYVFE